MSRHSVPQSSSVSAAVFFQTCSTRRPRAMSDRNAKRRRLVATGLPHSKLVEFIKRLRDHPVDESISRQMLQRSLDELWAATGCVLKLQYMAGEISWDLLSLPKTLQRFVSYCPPFQQMLRELFLRSPCTPNDPIQSGCVCRRGSESKGVRVQRPT